MKHFLLKFNHGVEIGARLAYLGHYDRTKDPEIKKIAQEEEEHRVMLEIILAENNEKSNPIIDHIFWAIGSTIGVLCKVSPIFMLNWVASSMEMFAVFSYCKLGKLYPERHSAFGCMAFAEERHKRYFRGEK